MMTGNSGQPKVAVSIKRVGENLFLRHGVYYALIKKGGKQIWKSMRTKDRNIARARLDEHRKGIRVARLNVTKEEIPIFSLAVKELLRICKEDGVLPKSLLSVKTHCEIAGKSFLGSLKISSIREDQVKEYLRQRFAIRTGRTANLDLIQIRKVFRLAVERGWRWNDPTKNIEPFPHKEKTVPVPSLEEVKAALTVLRDGRMRREGLRAADFLELLTLSGLRLAEAQALRRKDIDLQNGILIVREGKGGKSRIVDLSPSLRDFVERLLTTQNEASISDLIFPSNNKSPYNPKRSLTNACKLAKVPRFSFHGLRHAWATELVKAGIDFGTIAKWAGHNDGGLLIAKRYGRHMRRDHMQMAAQKATFSLVGV